MLTFGFQLLYAFLIIGFPIGLYSVLKGLSMQRLWWIKQRTLGKWFVISGVFLASMTFMPFFSAFQYSPVEVNSEYLVLDQLVLQTHPALLEGLRHVEFTTDSFNPEYYVWRLSSDAIGFYTPITRTIFIPVDGKMTSFSQFNTVWWHELAHHIWYYQLNPDQRQTYTSFHELSHELKGMSSSFQFGFPSEYGMTSVEEDFADSFSLFMTADWSRNRGVSEEGADRMFFIEDVLYEIADCIDPGCLKILYSASTE